MENLKLNWIKNVQKNLFCTLVDVKNITARPITLCYGKLEIIKTIQLQKITKEEIKKVCGLMKNIINLDEDRIL